MIFLCMPSAGASDGYLTGLIPREQEVNQAISAAYNTDDVQQIKWASYGGGLNVRIMGVGLMPDPEANLIIMECLTSDFNGLKFLAPQVSLDDSFQSQMAAGNMAYRLPSITELTGFPIEIFAPYSTLTF